MRINDDHTIFAWEGTDIRGDLLASSPAAFSKAGNIVRSSPSSTRSFSATNKGIQLHLSLTRQIGLNHYIAILECQDLTDSRKRVGLHLKGSVREGFVRHPQAYS